MKIYGLIIYIHSFKTHYKRIYDCFGTRRITEGYVLDQNR